MPRNRSTVLPPSDSPATAPVCHRGQVQPVRMATSIRSGLPSAVPSFLAPSGSPFCTFSSDPWSFLPERLFFRPGRSASLVLLLRRPPSSPGPPVPISPVTCSLMASLHRPRTLRHTRPLDRRHLHSTGLRCPPSFASLSPPKLHILSATSLADTCLAPRACHHPGGVSPAPSPRPAALIDPVSLAVRLRSVALPPGPKPHFPTPAVSCSRI